MRAGGGQDRQRGRFRTLVFNTQERRLRQKSYKRRNVIPYRGECYCTNTEHTWHSHNAAQVLALREGLARRWLESMELQYYPCGANVQYVLESFSSMPYGDEPLDTGGKQDSFQQKPAVKKYESAGGQP